MSLKQILVRVAGIALIVAAIAGLVFSVAGIVVLGPVEEKVETAVAERLELLDRTLAATADGLAVAEASLGKAATAIGSLEGTLAGIGQAVSGTVPTLDQVTELLGESLPATFEATQEVLLSVASSAQLVDDLLRVVTGIPLLGLEEYSPDVPLSQGLAEVALKLEGFPQAFDSAEEDLRATKDNLQTVEDDFATMALSVGALANDLEEARSVLVEYQEIVGGLQGMISSAQQSLPEWLRMLRLGLSVVLVWLAIAQIGLLAQGWELIERSRAAPPSESSKAGDK
jgi:hypothetical protein